MNSDSDVAISDNIDIPKLLNQDIFPGDIGSIWLSDFYYQTGDVCLLTDGWQSGCLLSIGLDKAIPVILSPL
jgi:hypothetical protein